MPYSSLWAAMTNDAAGRRRQARGQKPATPHRMADYLRPPGLIRHESPTPHGEHQLRHRERSRCGWVTSGSSCGFEPLFV